MPQPTHIILPDTGANLLRRELAEAFSQAGCRVSRPDPATLLQQPDAGSGTVLDGLLESGPALLFSVNFQGLSDLEKVWARVTGAGGDVAVWCVDNPWNILSGVRSPLWQKLLFLVTDKSFVAPLRRNGALRAFHLPLAGSPSLFAPPEKETRNASSFSGAAPVAFVGRSAFPGKERFFHGLHAPEEAMRAARQMMRRGERPDLAWWEKTLDMAQAPFWPGQTARKASFAAEESNLAWRGMCLRAAAKAGRELVGGQGACGLDIYGDAGWKAGLPQGARLLPPVDYYAGLAFVYAKARYSLALTSLQLPCGVNQRHFDVWLAGGFCLMDASPGLDLFPEELTRPVSFRSPEEIGPRIRELERGGAARLQKDWRACLLAGHTYRHRVAAVFEALAGAPAP